jgi:hypothetical protein
MHRCGRLILTLVAVCFGATIVDAPLASRAVRAQSSDRDGRGDPDRDADERDRRDYGRGGWRDRGRNNDDRNDNEDRPDRSASTGASDRASSASRPAMTPASGATSMNMTDYAKSLVKQHDKNGNMMLEANEQAELRGRSATADANNDKVITVDELVAQFSGSATATTSRAAPSAAGPASDDRRASDRPANGDPRRVFTGSAGGNGAGSKETDKRRSYRFTPAAEHLPSGLPSWFKSRDKNGDGQVAMSEYGRTWSSRLVAEFRRYDSNDDGIITPKEVAKK